MLRAGNTSSLKETSDELPLSATWEQQEKVEVIEEAFTWLAVFALHRKDISQVLWVTGTFASPLHVLQHLGASGV